MSKNISQSKIKWLMGELPELQSKQLIDGSVAQKLTEYYQEQIKERPTGQKYFLLRDHPTNCVNLLKGAK